ncbi:MAG: hypothetical protein KAZ87_11545 [Spirochaetes bacterium]|nr:hypothetical protein [Spirochaetota bacterium]
MTAFKLYAVCGNPVLHSKSPDIYNMLFEKHGIDARYIRVRPENASEALSIYDSLGFSGMNVTAPFKEDLCSILSNKNEDVILTGAVNTISGKDKSAFNTDIYGVESTLRMKSAVSGMEAVVLGAGGAAKAAVCALKNIGADITIINRTEEKAKLIAEKYSIKHASFSELKNEIKSCAILVSTLPAPASAFAGNCIHSGMIVLDAIYKDSSLESVALSRGAKFAKGIDWLINQGIKSFEIYTGKSTSYEETVSSFNPENVLGRKERIALIGFMGSGKSTVGKILAEKTGRDFYDIDGLIEKKAGKSINDIFATSGADYFRSLESEVLAEVLNYKNSVISCGGGIILRKENVSLLKESAVTVWIYASIASSVKRLDSSRPLLNVEDPVQRAMELFSERKKLYASACDLLVSNENKTAEKCAEIIYEEIR